MKKQETEHHQVKYKQVFDHFRTSFIVLEKAEISPYQKATLNPDGKPLAEERWRGGDEGRFLNPKDMFFVLKIRGSNDTED